MSIDRSLLLVLVLLAACYSARPINPSKIIVALNCGTKDAEVDSFDKTFKYKADSSFVTGDSVEVDYQTNDEARDADIRFTFEKRLYMYERHTYKEMAYALPIKQGKVTLILKFAEMYFRNAGERVFNIKIGNKVVREDFDVVKLSGGKYSAHEEYIEIEVQKDGVYFEGSKIPGAIANNKLKLSFVRGRADNPIVQGIIVYHDSIENSPQSEFKALKEKWQSQKQIQKSIKEEQALRDLIAIQKKKEKIFIRNDQLIVEKNEQVSSSTVTHEKFGFLRRLAMSSIGILFWAASFGIAVHVLYKYVFLISPAKNE